jgi:lipopolysaccharide/colanic/teichoic acid biosynthesis glycosyltransferase
MERNRSEKAKRVLDVVVGSALALLAVPVILGLALVMACTLRCSPFFVQQRVGRDGRLFRFWKLRTLPTAAPVYADKYAIAKIPIPAIARFLRSTHLDELPQLFLVPLGLMSLVGPRPEMPQLHSSGEDGFARARTAVRPGCTGLWQISDAYHRLIWEAPEYDLAYLSHANIRLDLWILWRTAAMMVGRASPVSLADVPAWVLDRRAPAPAGVPAEMGRMRGAGSCA